jgi:hypothetical protein
VKKQEDTLAQTTIFSLEKYNASLDLIDLSENKFIKNQSPSKEAGTLGAVKE